MSTSDKPSKTAELVAAIRYIYTLRYKPTIFSDEYAHHLCGGLWRTISRFRILSWVVTEIQLAPLKPITLCIPVRSAFGEERVEKAIRSGVSQFVILGAGYDSFGLRRTDLSNQVTIYELDQPATQLLKLKRMKHKGIARPSNVRYISGDLNVDDMFELLIGNGFEPKQPAIFSWFGVNMYLPVESVVSTLKQISETCAAGSSVLFDILYEESAINKEFRNSMVALREFVAKKGEPMQTFFYPDQVQAFVQDCGYSRVEVLENAEINRLYLPNRTDGLRYAPIGTLCCAVV